jgi:hypothetical protein
MVYDGFLAFAGTEIVNSPRAAAYARAMGITTVNCGGCETLPRALWSEPYISPDQDDAPWWDPTETASKEFAGLVGLEITGLSRNVGGRSLVPLTDNGAALHPFRRPHKEIQVRALAIARSECGLSYGYSWLASALRGSVCASGCQGDTLCFFTCCPGCGPVSDNPLDDDLCGDPYWRTMLNVGLLATEQPIKTRIPGGWLSEVTFTFAAGNPYIWREPVLMAQGPSTGQILPDYADPGVPPECFEPADCLQADDCPAPPAPVLPPAPVDACFPQGPFTASRAVLPLPQERVPIWSEKVPLIIIKAGSSRIERLTIRWYANPNERDCATQIDPCSACAEVNIAYVPQGSTLTIDGRIESAFVDCPGGPGVATAEPQLYGRGGTPFVWPVFSCADGTCLEFITRSGTFAPDASIEVFYVVREDAA